MNRRFLPGIALVFLLSAVVPGFPASFTGGGVTLQLDDRARVVGMAVGEKALKVAPEPLWPCAMFRPASSSPARW